jgi:hypothetical protein
MAGEKNRRKESPIDKKHKSKDNIFNYIEFNIVMINNIENNK